MSHLVEETDRWDYWLSGIRGSSRTMCVFAQEQSSPVLRKLDRICNRYKGSQ